MSELCHFLSRDKTFSSGSISSAHEQKRNAGADTSFICSISAASFLNISFRRASRARCAIAQHTRDLPAWRRCQVNDEPSLAPISWADASPRCFALTRTRSLIAGRRDMAAPGGRLEICADRPRPLASHRFPTLADDGWGRGSLLSAALNA